MNKTLLALSIVTALSLPVAAQDLTPNLDINGQHLQTLKSVMGNVSPLDMQGYKALFMMADSREDKAHVVKMMIVNETSTTNILEALASNPDFVNAYPEFFMDGTGGSPVPTQELTDLVNGKRTAQWTKEVKSFYSKLENTVSELDKSGDNSDYQKAINLLDSISIQGQKSLLDTLQANGHLTDAPVPTEQYSKDTIEQKLRDKNTETGIQPPLFDGSPKDGSIGKKVGKLVGNISHNDMQGYQALFAMSQTREQKEAVLKMMIVNEASSSDIAKYLGENEQFLEEFDHLYEKDENGEIKKDRFGNPIPTKELEAVIDARRSQKWGENVKPFYQGVEDFVNGIENDVNKQKALDLLASISIQGQKSLLETLQNNGHLTGEEGTAIPDLEDKIVEHKESELRNRYEKKEIDSGKEFVEEINNIVADNAEAEQFVDDYISADDASKQAQAEDVVNKASAEQIALMKSFTFAVPANGDSAQSETNLWDYLNGVANGDINPEIDPIDTKNWSHTDADAAKLKALGIDLKDTLTASKATISAVILDLQSQIDDLQSGNNPTTPETPEMGQLVKGLEKARGAVENEITNIHTQLDTKMDKAADDLVAASATAESEITDIIAAMQAQLTEQAALIAELQAGNNPSNPETPEMGQLVEGLEQAGETLKQKTATATAKLQKAKQGFEKAAEGVRNGNPVGINPPVTGPAPNYEFGSVGNGMGHAWAKQGVTDLYQASTSYADKVGKDTLAEAKAYTDSRIEDVQEDLDHAIATAQAVTAARPYMNAGHQSAFGVGLGQAGDSAAISVGYAHRLSENWTLNGNVSGTKGNDVNFSAGVGASYSW